MRAPRASFCGRKLPSCAGMLFIAACWSFGHWGTLFRANALDHRGARIWREAQEFLCSCFCAGRSYDIDETRLLAFPSALQFGFSVSAIPVRKNSDDLRFWIDQYLLHRLVMTPLRLTGAYELEFLKQGLGTLHEFSSSVIIRAPPRLSFAQQAQLLDVKTGGDYYRLVQLSEATGDPKVWRQRRALERRWFGEMGYDGRESHDGRQSHGGGNDRTSKARSQPASMTSASSRSRADRNSGAFSESQSLSPTNAPHNKESVASESLSESFIEQPAEWANSRQGGGTVEDLRSAPDNQSRGETQTLPSGNTLEPSLVEKTQHQRKLNPSSTASMGDGSLARKLVLNQDTTRYKTVHQKQKVWNAVCRKACYRVALQPASAINFQYHNEFAFLKLFEDPYDAKSWISSEPLHAGDVYMSGSLQPEGSEKSKRGHCHHWEERNRQLFSKIFQAFRSQDSSLAMRLPTCTGLARQLQAFIDRRSSEETTWSTLLQRFGVLRHPAQMAEPPRVYMPFRERRGVRNVRVAYYAKKPTADLPRIYKTRKPVPVDAALAIYQKLMADKEYPVQWPVNTPNVIATPVSPQYWFTANLERGRRGQYKLVSHFAGRKVPEAPMLVEFLGLYVQAPVAQLIKQKMEEILENIWTPYLVQRYEREGIWFGRQKEMTGNTEGKQRAASKNAASEFLAEPEKREKRLDGSIEKQQEELRGALSGSQLRGKQRGNSRIGSGVLQPVDEPYGSQEGSDSQASFHERYSASSLDKESQSFNGNKHSSENDSQRNRHFIQSIEVEYVGEIHLGCWLHQPRPSSGGPNQSGQSPLLSMASNNRLVFVIRGVSATLIRLDGLRLTTMLEGDPIALEFISPPKQGISYMMTDSHQHFRRTMSEFRGWSHKLLRLTLLNIFKPETDYNFFMRNTCPLIPESTAHSFESGRSSSIVEKGIAAGDSTKTSTSPWIYKLITHSQGANLQLYGNVPPLEQRGAPETDPSPFTFVYLHNKLLRDSLNQHLMKCYGRILPTAAIGASASPAQGEAQSLRRWECLEVPVKQRYELVERVHPLAATFRNFT